MEENQFCNTFLRKFQRHYQYFADVLILKSAAFVCRFNISWFSIQKKTIQFFGNSYMYRPIS